MRTDQSTDALPSTTSAVALRTPSAFSAPCHVALWSHVRSSSSTQGRALLQLSRVESPQRASAAPTMTAPNQSAKAQLAGGE